MPAWSEIVQEVEAARALHGDAAWDLVRRKYLRALSTHSGRDTILYATRWIQPGQHFGEAESIIDEDQEGMMEAVHGLKQKKLDLILHSPGGSAEATEALVTYLRKKFDNIRVIVPHAAMSAATMWACSADRIVMGKHSSLGPIDPQLLFSDGSGGGLVIAAQSILDQFDLAREECKNPELLNVWVPMLGQYGPGLLVQCENAIALSEALVKEWLRSYMFRGRKYAARDARRVARSLSSSGEHLSHARHIGRDAARGIGGGSIGLVVDDLETDPKFQDLVLSVYHSAMFTFSSKTSIKIIENHNGRGFYKSFNAPMSRPTPRATPAAGPSPPPGPPA